MSKKRRNAEAKNDQRQLVMVAAIIGGIVLMVFGLGVLVEATPLPRVIGWVLLAAGGLDLIAAVLFLKPANSGR